MNIFYAEVIVYIKYIFFELAIQFKLLILRMEGSDLLRVLRTEIDILFNIIKYLEVSDVFCLEASYESIGRYIGENNMWKKYFEAIKFKNRLVGLGPSRDFVLEKDFWTTLPALLSSSKTVHEIFSFLGLG